MERHPYDIWQEYLRKKGKLKKKKKVKVEKVLRLKRTRKEKVKYAIEMREANMNAKEIQEREIEGIKRRREERNRIKLAQKSFPQGQ